MSGRVRQPGEVNGKSNNLNNTLTQIYKPGTRIRMVRHPAWPAWEWPFILALMQRRWTADAWLLPLPQANQIVYGAVRAAIVVCA